ncbi:hypothetical protein ACNI3K_00435 [Demequina sp. SO4-13]|uniref:hypothetical protein n=1 Tax=Demequina sp. SO4-13 TaxID=3401027 RepID=UPI003AF8EF5E
MAIALVGRARSFGMCTRRDNTTEVSVAFAREPGVFERQHIAGPSTATFSGLLRASFAANDSTFSLLLIEDGIRSDNPHAHAWCLIDEDVTLGQVQGLVGDDTLYMDDFGRGGGGAPDFWLLDVVLSGAAWEALKRGESLASAKLRQRVYAEHRSEAAHWRASGAVSPRLMRLIKVNEAWHLPSFISVFDLEESDARDLLSTCQYMPSRYEPDTWLEPDREREA